jgi:hypothetical protein
VEADTLIATSEEDMGNQENKRFHAEIIVNSTPYVYEDVKDWDGIGFGVRTDFVNEAMEYVEPKRELKDGTAENPIRASEFLAQLDLNPVMDLLESKYGDLEYHYRFPTEAMLKALIFRRLKKIRHFTKLERHLKTHEKDTQALGFDKKQDGTYKIPDRRTFRHFENVRLGRYGLQQLMDAMIMALKDEMARCQRKLGSHVAIDGMPFKALDKDKECHFNPHYKIKGWKTQTILDIDYNIPLAVEITDVIDADAPQLQPLLAHLDRLGFDFDGVWADGAYVSRENLAVVCQIYKAKQHFNFRKDVTWDVGGEPGCVKTAYNKCWKDPDFNPEATFEEMMDFLLKRSNYDIPGSYWRNKYYKEWTEDYFKTKLEYDKRPSRMEGFHGHIKEHLNLEKYLDYKGIKNVERHVLMCYITLIAVALCRAQHGKFEGMTSVEYLE